MNYISNCLFGNTNPLNRAVINILLVWGKKKLVKLFRLTNFYTVFRTRTGNNVKCDRLNTKCCYCFS